MSNKNSVEYQSRFRADTSELEKANRKLKETGREMNAVAQGASALAITTSGLRDVLRGNASGLVSVAYGAGLAFRAFSQLAAPLKVLGVALAVASAAQLAFTARKRAATKAAEELVQKLNDLRIAQDALATVKDNHAAQTEALRQVTRAAEAAANAYVQLRLAQQASVQAGHASVRAGLDLEEVTALSNPNLGSAQRRDIQRQFIDRRAELEKTQAQEAALSKDNVLDAERSQLRAEARGDAGQIQNLSDAVAEAKNALVEEVASALMKDRGAGGEAIAKTFRARAGRDLDGAMKDVAPYLTTDQASQASGLIGNVRDRERDLDRFSSDASARAVDRAARDAALLSEQADIRRDAESRVAGAEATRVAARAGLDREEAAEKIEEEKRVRAAQQVARRDIAQYNYDKLGEEEQLGVVDRAIERTRKALGRDDLTDIDRAGLQSRLVEQMRERDRVKGGIESRDGAAEAQVSRLQSNIEALVASRHERDVGIRDVFQHMYDVKGGKNPDEIAAQNSILIEQHTKQIAELLESLKQ